VNTDNGARSRDVVVPMLCTDLSSLFVAGTPNESQAVEVGPVVVYSTSGAGAIDSQLVFPAETESVAKAIEGRQRAFQHGRACARMGLRRLGLADAPIVRRQDRSPAFSDGVTGSITHTNGFVAAAVAQLVGHAYIGIDAERLERTGPDVSRRILNTLEHQRVDGLPEPQRSRTIMAIFSAKEALYKAQHQFTRSWLGFEDVEAVAVVGGWEMGPATNYAAQTTIRWPAQIRQHFTDGLVVSAAVCAKKT